LKFEYKALAPNYKLINSFKKKLISEDKFIVLYKEQLSELNPKNVIEHLNFITGDFEPVLMCHCAKTKFCHRHLVADWLEKELGVNIVEFNVTDFERKQGYLKKKSIPSLFNEED
tara:strand:+ start:276 stop:620 length:345 start_codon:yes stop_codon:yes gene_type:complete